MHFHILTAALIALIGVAAYQTNGFRSTGSTAAIKQEDLLGSELAQTLDRNIDTSAGSLNRLLDSSTRTAEGYAKQLSSEMTKEVSEMNSYVEGQMRQLANTVQGPSAGGRRSSSARRSSSQKFSTAPRHK